MSTADRGGASYGAPFGEPQGGQRAWSQGAPQSWSQSGQQGWPQGGQQGWPQGGPATGANVGPYGGANAGPNGDPYSASYGAPQPAPEEVIARLRPHSRVLFWPSVALIVLSGLGGYFNGRLPETWQNQAVLLAAAVLMILVWVFPLVAWLGKHYTITTRRIIIRRGLFVRTRQELMHTRGYDLTVRKNGVQSLFGSGDVLINTGLDRPVVLWDVPGADLVQSTLHDLMEENINAVARLRQQEQSAPPEGSTLWNGN